jgi:hypothetical protein
MDLSSLSHLRYAGKFSMATFVRPHAQKVTAEIYPVQLIVKSLDSTDLCLRMTMKVKQTAMSLLH